MAVVVGVLYLFLAAWGWIFLREVDLFSCVRGWLYPKTAKKSHLIDEEDDVRDDNEE